MSLADQHRPERGRIDPSLLDDVDQALADSRDAVVATAQTLVRFETVSVDLTPGSQRVSNEEADLQEWIGGRFADAGFRVDQWEPDPRELARHPMIPPWHHWRGRPITVGTLPGVGSGRSLIINGHIDVVDPGDPSQWSTPPFAAEIRDDRLIGRGAADMKGGITAALVATETLRACGIQLGGDVIFEVVGDEETGGMGTIAAAERGYRAEAGVCPEPSALNMYVATRGIIHARLGIPGRSAHAEVNQGHWRSGGGVNANHKAVRIANELLRVADRLRAAPESRHPLLGPPGLQLTELRGGTFIANIPERCEIAINATYLPAQADPAGFGSEIRTELVETVERVTAEDDWLREHPPEWLWLLDYPPCEIPPDAGIVAVAAAAARSVGRGGTAVGTDTGYDGALLTGLYGIPCPAFGPGSLDQAHATDESIAISELMDGARAYARLLLEWCGYSTGRPRQRSMRTRRSPA